MPGAAPRLVVIAAPEGPWRDALVAAPLCLVHLGALLAAAGPEHSVVGRALAGAQLARLDRLVGRLDASLLHSGHHRRGEMTAEERRSVGEVVDTLAGAPRR